MPISGLSEEVKKRLTTANVTVDPKSYEKNRKRDAYEFIESSLKLRSSAAKEALSASLSPEKTTIKILEIGPGKTFEPAAHFMASLKKNFPKKKINYTSIENWGDHIYSDSFFDSENSEETTTYQQAFFDKAIKASGVAIEKSEFIIDDASDSSVISDEALKDFDIIFLNNFPCGDKKRKIPSDDPWFDYARGIQAVWRRLATVKTSAVFAIFTLMPNEIIQAAEWLCNEGSKIYGGNLAERTLILRTNPPQKNYSTDKVAGAEGANMSQTGAGITAAFSTAASATFTDIRLFSASTSNISTERPYAAPKP
jgi:hypothetical protein